MNNMNIEFAYTRLAATSDPLQIERVADFSLRETITTREGLLAAFWVACRDGGATVFASAVALASTLAARLVTRYAPPTGHAFAALTAAGSGVAAGAFGSRLGEVVHGPRGKWVGGAVSTGLGAGLILAAVYSREEEDQALVAVGLFGTALYSVLRDVAQGVLGKRLVPRLTLDSGKALRWQRGDNTTRHVGRLSTAFSLYLVSCSLFNGLLARNVVSPNFGGVNQPFDELTRDSFISYGCRTLNEAMDGFFGVFLLYLFFPDHVRPGTGWCSGQGDDWSLWARETSGRVFLNGSISSIDRLVPKPASGWTGSVLTALTEFRGTLVHLQRPTTTRNGSVTLSASPRQLPLNAAGLATGGGGDCLLHAAAGEASEGEWRCSGDAALRLRAKLCDRIRDLPAEQHRPQVEYHLQQVIAHLNAGEGIEGFERVVDGDALVDSLPAERRNALQGATSLEARTQLAATWLANPDDLAALLPSVANYYRAPGRYLAANIVPLLAQELERPLALQVGHVDTTPTRFYDSLGQEVDQAPPGTVYIHHGVSECGEAGDHFRRIEPLASELHRMSSPDEMDEHVQREEPIVSQAHQLQDDSATTKTFEGEMVFNRPRRKKGTSKSF